MIRTLRQQRFLELVLGLGFVLVALVATRLLADHFTVVKWLMVNALAGGALTLVVLSGVPLRFPVLPRRIWIALLALAALMLVNYVSAIGFVFNKVAVDRLTFLALTVAFFCCLKGRDGALRTISYWVSGATALVSIVGWLQACHWPVLEWLGRPSFAISSTFGNANMTAEFVGAGLFLQIHAAHSTRGFWRQILTIAAGLTLAYVVLLLSRSAWIGLTLGLLIFLAPPCVLKMRMAALVAVTALVFLVTQRGFAPNRLNPSEAESLGFIAPTLDDLSDAALSESKERTANVRLLLWGSTLAMIRDRPFGAGPGLYEFGSVPYQAARGRLGPAPNEGIVFKSPHNDYLYFAAENGLPALILFAGILAFFGWSLLKAQLESPRPERTLAMALAAFMAVQAGFQFPVDNASSVYCLALLLALTLSEAFPSRVAAGPPRLPETMLTAAAVVALVIGGYRYGKSNHLAFHAAFHLPSLTEACRLDPFNWRACTKKAYMQFNVEDVEGARQTLTEVLTRQPYTLPAIKLLGQIDLHAGRRVEGCDRLKGYGELVEKSQLWAKVAKDCS